MAYACRVVVRLGIAVLCCLMLVGAAGVQTLPELEVEVEGRGNLFTERAGPSQLDRVEIDLKADGSFILAVVGSRRHTLRGRWKDEGEGRITLSVRDAFGGWASGGGVLTLENGRFHSLRLDGDSREDRFRLYFDVSGEP